MINWVQEKETLDKLVSEGKNYKDIAKIYGVSECTARVQCRKMGVFLEGAKIPPHHNCPTCGRPIYGNEKQTYCSLKCQHEKRVQDKYLDYLEHQSDYEGSEISYLWLKKHILEEQNHTCAIDGCGCKDEWNGKKLIFVLDHIDGDATNNRRDNLRLVCPNCDSQLPTYKAKNKGKSTRTYKPYVNGKLQK